MKKVVLVAGRGRHGKDTFAEECMQYLDNAEKFEMSTDLWSCVAEMMEQPIDKIMRHKDDKKEIMMFGKYYTPRYFAQYLGNNLLKMLFGKQVWVMLVQGKINRSKADVIFITGIRLLSEVEDFKKMNNCEVVKIERVNQDGSTYLGVSEEDAKHQTEKEVDSIKYDRVCRHFPLSELENNAKMLARDINESKSWI